MSSEGLLILSFVGVLILFSLDFAFQYLYARYFSVKNSELSCNRKSSDELIFLKTSKLVRQLSSPLVKFECPREMTVGKESSVQLSIRADEDFKKEFGQDVQLKLKIQPWVKADISNDKFQIQIRSEEFQPIQKDCLEWTWTVLPCRQGIHGLALHLVFSFEGNFGEQTHNMWLDERTIMVSENIFNTLILWCKTKWKWITVVIFKIILIYFILKYLFGTV
ncbi:MAG: hypothetical protein QM734_05205 [Cyclobacteriaceae bacterium]